MENKNKKILTLTAIVLIVLLGFVVRSYNIENAPGGIYPDEAVNGMDALKAYKGEGMKWFYPDNNGREGLFINLIALAYGIFGVTIFGLKFWSIIFGTLTIVGTYLLTKEMLKNENAGLIAAFLVSFSFWSINFSRIAFRAIMLPAILVFSFYFIFRGLRTKKYSDFIFSGLIFGLGIHTYIAFRIAPVILIALFIALIFTRKNFIKKYWKPALVFIMAAAISAAPLLLDFYKHPEYVESRSGSISIFSPEVNNGHLIKTGLRSFALSVAKYNFWGDQNWRHNLPPFPVLNPIAGTFFLIGLLYLIVRFIYLVFIRIRNKKKSEDLPIYTFILVWFFSMLAPEFLTAEGIPHALRAIGTLPVIYIIATISILWSLDKAKKYGYFFKISTISLILFFLLFSAIFNIFKYHIFWAESPAQHNSFQANLMKISDYIKTVPQNTEKFIITGPMERIPIKLFNDELENTYYVYPDEIKEINPKNQGRFQIISPSNDNEIIQSIIWKFPWLSMNEKRDEYGNSFYVLK